MTSGADWRWVLAAFGCIISAACKRAEPLAVRPAEAPTLGSLSLQIQLAGSIVPEIAYEIRSAERVARSGKFLPNAEDDIFTAVVGALPANDRYSIVFDAKAASRQTGQLLPCGGSATFQIIAGQTTVLGVLVRCSDVAAPPTAASASSANSPRAPHRCASITAVRALPGEAPVGKQVTLKTDIALGDATLEQLHFEWSANTGKLSDDRAAEATFLCTSAGVATVTLKLSEAFEACHEERVFVYVTCSEIYDGSSGAVTGGAGAGAATRMGTGGA